MSRGPKAPRRAYRAKGWTPQSGDCEPPACVTCVKPGAVDVHGVDLAVDVAGRGPRRRRSSSRPATRRARSTLRPSGSAFAPPHAELGWTLTSCSPDAVACTTQIELWTSLRHAPREDDLVALRRPVERAAAERHRRWQDLLEAGAVHVDDEHALSRRPGRTGGTRSACRPATSCRGRRRRPGSR